ncbi:Protein transport protein SEC31 -like protein B [Babesia sp. Xinjiang]|uniref:Protein transport protein SEC31 -like protein B n=1 Tax=Babesia sp. Xinjiang TaxID=462227 RepID=UPI000A240CC4|nr:Protein transport protein SEC31 -like protein B [Babesia sp. Xinjiang]ORM41991.1 Protein transport protein SEC31 -like protein B [Babesia sp. Xinjiang]
MKGLGIFSPFSATSGCILSAPGYDEFCGNGSPRINVDNKTLLLLGFEIKERTESTNNPFELRFDANTNYNTFGNDNIFSNLNDDLGGYDNLSSGVGIADFTTYHSVDLQVPEGNLSALVWIECGGSNGIIAVGTTTGDLYLFDGKAIVEGDAAHLISKTKVCNIPIKCLSYNAKTNVLGVAGLDGQISVCDLANPNEPKVIDTSYGKWRVGLVTGLSWNHRLGHILATSGSSIGPSGAVSPSDSSGLVVWDLKARKPASSFRDPSGRTNPIAVEWMPEQMTQLIVGYGDDRSPALQLWDLRNCSVPLKEVRGHTMGLTGLALCPQDPNLLLTSGRDDHTRCWTLDNVRGPFHAISSMQTGALSHHKRVQWHPQVPGLFLAQDTDDDLSVHNAMCMSQTESYMPAWVRRTSGVVSGFAGAVTTWNAAGSIKQFMLSSHLDDETTKALDDSLEVFCELADSRNFGAVCEERVASANSEFDKLTWSVMAALYKGDPSALVSTLGYELPQIQSDESNLEYSEDEGSVAPPGPPRDGLREPFGHDLMNDDDGEAFFNSLCNKGEENSVNILGQSPVPNIQEGSAQENETQETLTASPADTPKSSGLEWGENDLCSRVIVGDYEGAAKLCLENDRPTEALFLAYAGGLDLWLKVSDEITQRANNPLLRTLHLVMKGETQAIVEQCPLDNWREQLVYIITTTMDDRTTFNELCNVLGNRLYASFQHGQKDHLLPASIFFMCSGDVSRVVDAWEHLETGKNSLHVLAQSVVRTAALSISVAGDVSSEYLGHKAVMLAEAFVDVGEIDKAVRCLSLPLISGSPQVAAFLARIKGMDSSVGVGQHMLPQAGRVPVAPVHVVTRKSCDYGTAPGAVAGAMYPGMPVPWPLPTATQQKASSTRSTEDANRRIIATSAAVLPQQERLKPADLEFVTTVLGDLIAHGDTSRAAQENRRRIADLMASLGKGEHTAEANELILSMCRAIHSGDQVNANIILSTISTKLWNAENKNWIMCLKRIVPK